MPAGHRPQGSTRLDRITCPHRTRSRAAAVLPGTRAQIGDSNQYEYRKPNEDEEHATRILPHQPRRHSGRSVAAWRDPLKAGSATHNDGSRAHVQPGPEWKTAQNVPLRTPRPNGRLPGPKVSADRHLGLSTPVFGRSRREAHSRSARPPALGSGRPNNRAGGPERQVSGLLRRCWWTRCTSRAGPGRPWTGRSASSCEGRRGRRPLAHRGAARRRRGRR
jgi:hypothetical protein